MIGKTLGHYEIGDKIGAGGMGEVYRAHDKHLERDVAIKVLPRHLLDDASLRQRFRREALALSRLNHPNVATVHDFTSEGEIDFLVMEYVPGENLSERISRGPLPEPTVVDLGRQLAEGLRAAHERQLIHRDLKPGNLRVTEDGRLKILDFGLAKLVQPIDELSKTETMTQGIVGTVPYMSPEQLRNQPLDARTDIHAAGVVLYEMLTGRRRHADAQGVDLIDAILNRDAPPPSSQGIGVSADLETVVLKCMERDPQRRYQTAAELLEDLDRIHLGLEVTSKRSTAPAKPARYRRVSILAATAALLGLALIFDVGGLRTRLLGGGDGSVSTAVASLVVLPVESLSPEAEQDIWADAMTEELITSLQKIGQLERVISRRTAMRYRESDLDPIQIAEELDVDAVVEASLLAAGGRIRVNARVIHARANRDLWGNSFQRDVGDLLTFQGELASLIAEQIGLAIGPQDESRLARDRSVHPDALREYLLGRDEYQLGTPGSVARAIPHLQRTIEIDGEFAEGHAWLGLALAWARGHGVDEHDTMERGREAVRRALELDPDLAMAHVARAAQSFWFDLDAGTADLAFQRALELDPRHPMVQQEASIFWVFTGSSGRALASARASLEADPLNPAASRAVGWILFGLGEFESALEQHQHTLELLERFPDPDELNGTRYQITWNLLELGRTEEIRSMLEDPGIAWWHPVDDCLLTLAEGDTLEARRCARSTSEGHPLGEVRELSANVLARTGELDPYFELMDDYYRSRSARIWWMASPTADKPAALVQDPRWADMQAKLRLVH